MKEIDPQEGSLWLAQSCFCKTVQRRKMWKNAHFLLTHILQTAGLLSFIFGTQDCVYKGHIICEFDRNWPSGYRDTRGWKWQISGSCK